MNKKEIMEIRRRLNPERNNVTVIRGCYVGSDGQIMSTFTKNVATLPQAEFEKYAALFKKTLTGTQ